MQQRQWLFPRGLFPLAATLVATGIGAKSAFAQESNQPAPLAPATVENVPPEPEASAPAQGGPLLGRRRFMNRFLGMVPLLQIDSVRQELHVDGQQATQIDSLSIQVREDFAEEVRALLRSLRDPDSEEGAENRQRFREKLLELTERINQRLEAVLDRDQLTRLRQIDLQLGVRRHGAAEELSRRDLATALDLTNEQQQLLLQQAQTSPDGQREHVRSLEEARAEVNEVLTPEQQLKLENLLGAEFDLPAALLEGDPGAGEPGRRRLGRRPWRRQGEPAREADEVDSI